MLRPRRPGGSVGIASQGWPRRVTAPNLPGMRSVTIAAALAAVSAPVMPSPAAAQPLPVVTPRPGLVITRSVRVAPGHYRFRAAHGDSAILVVRGDGLTVDLRGVTFEGSDPARDPDDARGIAVRVDGGRDVRLRGLTARGYRIGILARGVRGLVLEDHDLSHGWKPRLYSLREHESLADWLSYHRNDAEEWQRHGTGIYLTGVTGGTLRGNRVRQGMNGIALVRTDSVAVRDNDVSFNSGVGIALYRARDNRIVGNRADYNVRGYVHGAYARGQDSAGILLFEQCTGNLVAYNSLTHGGDGVFLWAGQQTMDTGQGGSNDNLFLANDASFAPTNALEATFSRNSFVGNRAVGSTHGLWGGYSFQSRIVGNCFGGNRIAVAVEHGQDNLVGGNRFDGDSTGVRLWANPVEPSDWGYPRHRDTRSRDWRVVENRFHGVAQPLSVAATTGVDSSRNVVAASAPDSLGACDPLRIIPTTAWWRIPAIPEAPRRWPTSPLAQRDRSAILVDAWGPFDWRAPQLFPLDSVRARPLRLLVAGPPGRWRVVARPGVAALSAARGRTGDTLVVTPAPGRAGDWGVTLEYVGGATVSPRGVRQAAGAPVRFSWRWFEPVATWTQRVFAWDDATDPRTHPEAFAALLRGAPLLVREAPRLDWFWSRPRDPAIPARRMAMEAEATVALPPGAHALRVLSDDAVRVWVDDALVVDDWVPHETAVRTAPVSGGTHRVRVQFLQVDGWVELRLDWLTSAPPAPGGGSPRAATRGRRWRGR